MGTRHPAGQGSLVASLSCLSQLAKPTIATAIITEQNILLENLWAFALFVDTFITLINLILIL
ncbi:MAG: hypothetical protein LBR51_00615 [Bacteroidales bacterium]|nr:hypothetical protein [Bacteroidales bacterium]